MAASMKVWLRVLCMGIASSSCTEAFLSPMLAEGFGWFSTRLL